MATCIGCNKDREARTVDLETKLCKMCTLKFKQGKTLVSQAGSGKSVSNGDDDENNDNQNYGEEI